MTGEERLGLRRLISAASHERVARTAEAEDEILRFIGMPVSVTPEAERKRKERANRTPEQRAADCQRKRDARARQAAAARAEWLRHSRELQDARAAA